MHLVHLYEIIFTTPILAALYIILQIVGAIVAWGFKEGVEQWKHELNHPNVPYAMDTSDWVMVVFFFIMGPVGAICTMIVYGTEHWSRRFWTPRRKKAWFVLKKLESYTE